MAQAGPIPLTCAAPESEPSLLRQILLLAFPVMGENALHLLVSLTDTAMANYLPKDAPDATAAVGTISYFLWLIGLTTSAFGTGATALIARAKGARHRSLANSVCGQSISGVLVLGVVVAAVIFALAWPLVHVSGLHAGRAPEFAHRYLQMLAFAVPFSTVMFVANACLRGAGDTLTPALSMLVVDGINLFLTCTLTRGTLGMPRLGFDGIAIGTTTAYIVGGLLQFSVLLIGRGGVRLHLHRMRLHWLTLKRILRIGVPSGVEVMLMWVAQFIVLKVVNGLQRNSNIVPSAHTDAVRIEGLSYMLGFAVATAAATLVGQNLGARNPRRASRAAYLSFALGGGIMTVFGLLFIFFGGAMSRLLSPDRQVAELTRQCLFVTGFIQSAFAASIIFSGALRGAGDTMAVAVLNLASIIFVRLLGVVAVAPGGTGDCWRCGWCCASSFSAGAR